ncbi:MAG: hypothetical protein CSA83_00780 [Actinomycetales bacterium]|nr:MAG: hypothetical protein CSA83_00780 [Actinomycetales bacterium]
MNSSQPKVTSYFQQLVANGWLLVVATIAGNEVFYLINLSVWQATGRLRTINPWWLTALIAMLLIIQGLVLLWRNSHPVLVFGFSYAVFILVALLQGSRDLAAGPILWVAVFFLATSFSLTRVVILLAAIIGDIAIQLPELAQTQQLIETSTTVALYVIVVRTTVVYLVAAMLGVWAAWQRRKVELATERNELLRVQHEAQLRETLSRELHDIAAHHLSAITIQSQAALLAQPNEPELVTELLTDIRNQSRETLTSLRQIVGILRHSNDPTLIPEPTAVDIEELVDDVRKLGLSVKLQISGDLTKLPAAISLTCYRIVQESLSNIRRHAFGAAAKVVIEITAEKVGIAITNQTPPKPVNKEIADSSGFGIIGMRERVQLLGGEFSSAETATGGWETCATIPIPQESMEGNHHD